MTAQHLRDLEASRRHATLVTVVLDTRATLIDEIIDMHDRVLGILFNRAKRHHSDRFQQSGKEINDKLRLYSRIGRALVKAKQNGSDPFKAIESILPWEIFAENVTETEKMAQPANFDFLPLIGDGFPQLRRYTPSLLESLQLKATPTAQDLLEGVNTIKSMNQRQARKVPDDAPTSFVRKRWESVVQEEEGLDRRFYELCVLSELKNSLRSGNIWLQGSRQFRDFEEYLLPTPHFMNQLNRQELDLPVETDCDRFLKERLIVLERELANTEHLASQNELPDATITDTGLKMTPLSNAVPKEADALMHQAYSLLPHLKITDLLLEVDNWTHFTRHFTHLKSNDQVVNRNLLLTAILADAINLGLSKMAESCPGATYSKLSWLQAWHIRDERYSAGLAELVNAQSQQSFSTLWGDGTTSSSETDNGSGPVEQDNQPVTLTRNMVTSQASQKEWSEVLRLAESIKQGTVTASLMLRKLGSYPRQNGLAMALREIGRIERTLFTLEWLQSIELRRRVHVGLNKGEAKNALARAIFFNRLGELRDRSFENQLYRASGLNLVVAAIVLWNTVYLERAIQVLRASGQVIDDSLLQHLSPLGWEHINLTGDYTWQQNNQVERGKFRPLRSVDNP